MLAVQLNYNKKTNNVRQKILWRVFIIVFTLFNIANVSNAVIDTAYPTKPKNIRVEEVSGFRITISWEPSTDDVGVIKYIIFRGAEEIGNILPESQPDGRVYFSTPDVKPGLGFSYIVRAYDAAGKRSDAASIWIMYDLPIPKSIKIEHIKLSEIYFTWSLTDPNKYVEGIYVYKNGSLIATLSSSQFSYLDSSLAEEGTWEYQLGTYDKAGNKLLTEVFKIANTPFNGLRELMRRKNCETVRPLNLVVSGLTLQPELLHYKDTEYGTHVWRISNSSRCNTFAHNHINRTPWNANGSKIGLISDRCFPEYWCRESGCTGNTLLFVIDTDGGNFRHIPTYNNPNPFSCWCPDYQAGRMRHFVWDRFAPQYAYFSAKDGLYRMDMSQYPRYEKISDFPEKERYKVIYCLPSEQNVIMVIDDLAYNYLSPKFYFVNLNSPNEVISYPISFNLNFPPEHDLAKEYSFHDIHFTRSDNNDFTFNYGPIASIGESIIYRSSMDGLNVRLYYDGYGRTILDNGIKVPYHSHPSWGPEGNLAISTYFGEQYPKGSNKWGWQVADDDKGFHLKQLAKFSGGHTAWDGYDPDFLFASVRINNGENRIIKAHVGGPENNGELFVNPCTGLTDEKDGYQTLPRPAQSPDGTKVFYHSSMSTESDQYVDSYIAVARYPMPAKNVRLASENQPTIIWDPPKFCRETKGYHVYRTLDPAGDFTEIADSLNNVFSFTDLSITEGTGSYYYAVTSEEWSGLESDQLSNIIKVEYNSGYYTSGNFAEEGKKDFDHISPLPIANLTWNKIEEGIYKLTWDTSSAKDIWYYNIYYSNIGQPSPTQEYLIASVPKSHTSYIDWQAQKDLLAYYLVTAVDRQGNEGIENRGNMAVGDINNDGRVDILDVQACVNVILGVVVPQGIAEMAQAAAEPKDKCDVLDVQAVVNKILGG